MKGEERDDEGVGSQGADLDSDRGARKAPTIPLSPRDARMVPTCLCIIVKALLCYSRDAQVGAGLG